MADEANGRTHAPSLHELTAEVEGNKELLLSMIRSDKELLLSMILGLRSEATGYKQATEKALEKAEEAQKALQVQSRGTLSLIVSFLALLASVAFGLFNVFRMTRTP